MAKSRRKSKPGAETPGWVWMLFGLTLGLAVAVGVYLSGARPSPRSAFSAPKPTRASSGSASRSRKPGQGLRADTQSASAAERLRAAGAHGGSSTPPATPSRAGAAKAAARSSGGTEFDFYKILPHYEVTVPRAEAGKQPALPAPAPVETPGPYLLQAGSFRSFGEADRLKASLALLGIESQIEKARVGDDEYHRVQIGPIANLDRLNQLRNQLRKAGIDALVMRAGD
ncbi:MAG TPA: SPOR domain-containing protein [Gammaproteobacteria bacterium]|nr:SPOR domain-containing protein [Gammaproteobacteria bacterium]